MPCLTLNSKCQGPSIATHIHNGTLDTLCILRMRIRVLAAPSRARLYLACFTPVACFVGPESARKQHEASSNSFAYWPFHAKTFERKAFSKIHELKSKKSLKECRRFRWLQAETNAVAARAVIDKQTDRQTHTDTRTVTLAVHARRGLIMLKLQL